MSDRFGNPRRDDGVRSPRSATSITQGAAAAAGWSAASHATATAREQLAYLLDQRDIVQRIAQRFGNLGVPQQQGHVFEWMHELSFNLDAIAKHDDARLRVTTWLGEPHAPDDLRLSNGARGGLAKIQAKVIADSPSRLSAADGLASDKYADMQLLVPEDHVEPTRDLLRRRLRMPWGPLHDRYEDVDKRLTDVVKSGEVRSDPVDTVKLRKVTEEPNGYLKSLLSHNAMRQVVTAGGAAALVTGVVSGVSTVATERIRNGSFNGINWTRAAIDTSSAAAGAAAVAVEGQGISLLAQHAVANGSVGFAESLAKGLLPYAIARATWEVAGVTHGWATGRLSAEEAALAATEAIVRNASVWACAAIGQAVVPVPVLGAMVGGIVGQYGATMIVEGARLAIAARDMAEDWDREYGFLLEETQTIANAAKEAITELNETAQHYDIAFTTHVLPRLERLSHELGSEAPDRVLDDLADLTTVYGGAPVFSSLGDFDAFMADDDLKLVLNLSPDHPRS